MTTQDTTAPNAPKSVITFTEIEGGGFTIGVGLHGAHQEALNPDAGPQPVSIVDILALAVSHIVRTQPQAFRDSFDLVRQTIGDVNKRLDAGEDVGDVMADANNKLAGSLGVLTGE